MRVIVTGKLKARTYDTREGAKRTVVEIDVDEVGPSLRGAEARVTRAERWERGQDLGGATRFPTPSDEPPF